MQNGDQEQDKIKEGKKVGNSAADPTGSLRQGPTQQVAEEPHSDTETEHRVIHHRGNSGCQGGKLRDEEAVPGQMGWESEARSSERKTGQQPEFVLKHTFSYH